MDLRFDSNKPLVSVIVPAHDAAAHIEETLRSLLRQTYSNLEIIVVDDGSQDGTRQQIQSLAREDPRIRVIEQPCSGVAAARNRGIEASRGEFIVAVDADDIWFPSATEKLLNCLLHAGPEDGVAYGWWLAIDGEGQPLDGFCCSTIDGDVLATLVCHNFLGNGSSTMIRRECFEKVGKYDSRLETDQVQGCEDWDLYLRIAHAYRFRVVPEFLLAYRRSYASMSCNVESMAKSYQYLLLGVKQRHPRLPKILYRLSRSNFYLFLSHHCYHHEDRYKSFQWLGRALLAGPVFTLLRFRFYALIAENLLAAPGKLIKHRRPRNRRKQEKRARANGWISWVEDVKKKHIRIRLNTAAQNLLHRLVSGFEFSRDNEWESTT